MKPDKRFCFISSAGVFGLDFAQITVELMSIVIMSEPGKLGDFQEKLRTMLYVILHCVRGS